MKLLYLILMSQPASGANGQQSSSPWSTLVLMLVLMLLFWLFFIRPQSKKAKEQKQYQESLKKGDKIVTIGGIYGKIVEISEKTVVIESQGTKLEMDKSAINAEASAALNK
ncbi:MAG: preprotein translocase subunit YajC [Bacteroidales bacterium]|jgi:preprotein translocase subunit YajC|nr:preprotein translocase subunit YajC [Bacteroidales bacterium]